MIEFLEFTFRSFWTFIGVLILISVPLNFLFKMWNRFWRHMSIRKHGYPQNCDADGDFLKIKEEEEE